MKRTLMLSAALVTTALVAGCGGDTYVQATTSVSKGQELTDLQRALNEGAITQREYDDLRSKVMRRPN